MINFPFTINLYWQLFIIVIHRQCPCWACLWALFLLHCVVFSYLFCTWSMELCVMHDGQQWILPAVSLKFPRQLLALLKNYYTSKFQMRLASSVNSVAGNFSSTSSCNHGFSCVHKQRLVDSLSRAVKYPSHQVLKCSLHPLHCCRREADQL